MRTGVDGTIAWRSERVDERTIAGCCCERMFPASISFFYFLSVHLRVKKRRGIVQYTWSFMEYHMMGMRLCAQMRNWKKIERLPGLREHD